MIGGGRGSLVNIEDPVSLEFRKGSFHVGDGRDGEHPGPQRCSMRKSFTIPAEMFPHSPELLSAALRFKVPGMFEKNSESGCQ